MYFRYDQMPSIAFCSGQQNTYCENMLKNIIRRSNIERYNEGNKNVCQVLQSDIIPSRYCDKKTRNEI